MQPRRIVIICILFSMAAASVFGQTFPCNGDLIFSTNANEGRTNINRLFFIPFSGASFSRDRSFQGGDFNALGFNSRDNYIYAARINSNEIVRLKADNTFEVVGEVPNLDQLTTSAGDCTPDGYYLCHDQVLDQILVFDVVDNFALVNQVDLFWAPAYQNGGSFTPRIDDFVIDPNDPTVAYSFQGDYFDPDLKPDETRGYFLKINLDFQSPDLGMVTPIAPIPRNIIRKIGALFFSPIGTLYAYGSTLPGPDPIQNKLLTINKNTGDVTEFSRTGPEGINTDGCSCPYGLTFSNAVDPNFALCTDSKVTYRLTVRNWFFQDFPNTSIADTLAEGMIITNISGDFNGDIASGTGVGTRFLQLDNLNIPPKSQVTINIEAEIIDVPIDLISNQAFLTNLPERVGSKRVSDDPSTVGYVGDATNFYADPLRLAEFTIDVTYPTDCLDAMTGKMIISAPVLIPGLEYRVNMQNEKYAEFVIDVLIDDQHSFTLDSLWPGEYRLYKITPKNSACSFAMKDTTVAIIAPHEQVQAEVATNGPVCEGSTIALAVAVSPPGGDVEWKGPRMWSTDLEVMIDSATIRESGTYEMTYTYGFCEQYREFEMEVFPTIEAQISGPDGICERDTLRLTAGGEGNIQSFSWTDPVGIQHSQPILEIPNTGLEQEGLYEVIVGNGSCQDTAVKFIQVYPAPTLELPKIAASKFCEPLVLSPKLSGNTRVTYAWTPAEGLSCADCPRPEIDLPLQTDYTLQVSTDFACQDSANVKISLDPDGLIYIPNAFSPNYDGVNDHFRIFPQCGVATIDQFEIFGRFGNRVYSADSLTRFSDPNLFWDGKANGQTVGNGVYVWHLEMTLIDGTRRSLQGNVQVLR